MNISLLRKRLLRSGTALQAVALLGAGVATVAISAPAYAQDFTNIAATGRVVSTSGAPLPGATVTITSNGQGFSQTTTTDSSGAYSFSQIPTGSYTFQVSADGYTAFTDPNVVLARGQAANQFALSPVSGAAAAANGNEIVVTAGRVRIVDFASNTTGTSVNIGDLAQRVPIQRDITSVALLSPGATQGDTAFGSLPSLNGASVSENVYYLNGLNITSFRNGLGSVVVPFDLYQDVDIKNGGMTAEFGRTTGGAIIATTKSGSNEYHAGLTFNYEPDALRSKSPNTYNTDNDSRFSERREAIGEVSGPIIKDRLFIYAMGVLRDVETRLGSTSIATDLPPRDALGNIRPITASQSANTCYYYPQYCVVFNGVGQTGGVLSGTSSQTIAGTRYVGNNVLVGNQYNVTRNHSPFYAVKVDAIPIDGQRLEFTYFHTNSASLTNTFGTNTFSLASGDRYNPNTDSPGAFVSASQARGGGDNFVGRYTGKFTDWFTISGAYGQYRSADTTESSTPDFPSIFDSRSGTQISVGNVTSVADLSFEKRTFYRADADVFVNLLGSHHFRGGYDREELNLNSNEVYNGKYIYEYFIAGGASAPAGGIDPTTGLPNRTQYATQRYRVVGGSFNSLNEAFYLQDTWSLLNDRLLLNLGVRDDRFTNKNGVGETFYSSGDQFAPRLGFSFDVFGDRQTKFYGSYSRYFLPVAANTNLRLAGGELDYDTYYILNGLNADQTPILGAPITNLVGGEPCVGATSPGNSCVVRNDGAIPGTATTVAGNLKPQSTDEYILGIEHRLGSRMKVGIYGTYVKLNESLEDAYIDQALVPACIAAGDTAALCRSVFNGTHQYNLINPGSDVLATVDGAGTKIDGKQILLPASDLGLPQAKRTYKAVTLTFDREWDGRWDLHASYTWSKNEGNIEGGIRSDNGQTDSGLTTAFDFPGFTGGTYGYLPNDRRHNFKVYGSYKVFDWLTLGANAQVTSPRSYGCLGKPPAYVDSNAFKPSGVSGPAYNSNTTAFYCAVANGQVLTNPVGFTVLNPAFPGTAANSNILSTPRGSVFQSDWLYNVNLDALFKLPIEQVDTTLRVSVFNVFNQSQKLDFVEQGTTNYVPNPVYGQPNLYQTPRYVRLQLGIKF